MVKMVAELRLSGRSDKSDGDQKRGSSKQEKASGASTSVLLTM
jgi:hypothetical protein